MPRPCHRCELLTRNLKPPLSPPCRDYAAIVFFANNRFETGKKKLQYLSFGDFAYCAELMIQNWTLGAVGEAHSPRCPDTSPPSQGLLPRQQFSCRPQFPASFLLQCPHCSHHCSEPHVPTHSSTADRGPATCLWPGASCCTLPTLPFLSHGVH